MDKGVYFIDVIRYGPWIPGKDTDCVGESHDFGLGYPGVPNYSGLVYLNSGTLEKDSWSHIRHLQGHMIFDWGIPWSI